MRTAALISGYPQLRTPTPRRSVYAARSVYALGHGQTVS